MFFCDGCQPCVPRGVSSNVSSKHLPTLLPGGRVGQSLLTLGVSDLIIGVLELDVELPHRFMDSLEGLHNVAEDDWLPLELLVLTETLGVDEFHLLQDCGLSRLSGSCESVSQAILKNHAARARGIGRQPESIVARPRLG